MFGRMLLVTMDLGAVVEIQSLVTPPYLQEMTLRRPWRFGVGKALVQCRQARVGRGRLSVEYDTHYDARMNLWICEA